MVFIVGRGLVSPAGVTLKENWESLIAGKSGLTVPAGSRPGLLNERGQEALRALRAQDEEFASADRAVISGVLAARESCSEGGGHVIPETAVIMGSSRGATETLEQEIIRFRDTGKTSLLASPRTTGGAFASTIARDLRCTGLSLSVSSTCATGLHALGTAYALVRSGQIPAALAGGAEAPVTPFTLAQLGVLRVLADDSMQPYPCKPFYPERSGMILSEGAACLYLASDSAQSVHGMQTFGRISGYGAATEHVTLTGISEDGAALKSAISQALKQANLTSGDVSLIIGHGTGTKKGDAAELRAYQSVFGEKIPPLTFHKWMTGHMLGASAAASVALATEHLRSGAIPRLPYWKDGDTASPSSSAEKRMNHVLVTALGFGGNAGALVISR